MRPSVVAFLALMALTSTGCFTKKKQPAPVVPPAPQRPPVEMPATKVEPPPPLEAPKVEMPPQATPPEPTVLRPKLEKVEPPKPAPVKTARKKPTPKAAKPKEQTQQAATPPPAAATSTPVESTPPPSEAAPPAPAPLPPSTPAPQLGEVMPADQRKAYLASVDADLGAAQKVLREIEGRTLTSDQSETVTRVKAFVQQANEARASDLSGAVQLAKRAAILAGELAKSLD